MPLSKAKKKRTHLHTRTIEVNGYVRDDGQYDIDGHVKDTRSHDFSNPIRGSISTGEALHDMWLRITVDDKLIVTDAEAFSDFVPYSGICEKIAPDYTKLVGLQIGPDWSKAVSKRLGGIKGCTHLTELIKPVVTTAYMTVWVHSKAILGKRSAEVNFPPLFLNTCHALKETGEAIRLEHPEYFVSSEQE